MTEEFTQQKYPGVDLHNIEKNRICMSSGQLKKIFSLNNKDFNSKFLLTYEKKLIEKQKKSLDYYDVSLIIDQCLKRDSVQINIKEKKDQNQKLMS